MTFDRKLASGKAMKLGSSEATRSFTSVLPILRASALLKYVYNL
jgi:hypothetical protein